MTHPALPGVIRAMAALRAIGSAQGPIPQPVADLIYHALDELEAVEHNLGSIDEDLPNSLRARTAR